MYIKGLFLLLAANCLAAGRLLPQPETRIVGGKEVDIESAPWQVALQFNGVTYCGGSIYSETIIITAAHCLIHESKPLKAEDLTVLAGSANRFFSETIVKVAAIKPHNDFHSTKHYNDIGIVKLKTPLDLTTGKMQQIALADNDPAPGTYANVTGWGYVQRFPTQYNPIWLQGIDIIIQKQENCIEIYGKVTNGSICGGSAGHATCDGDSGGPLVVNNKLAGVVSYGDTYCTSLTVYTSVYQFRGWIEREAKSI